MLGEILQYLITSCPKYVRAMGYLHGAIAIEARYKRCAAAWQGHTDKSKALILEAADRCQNKKLAVVLGSGILSDIPLAELSATFERVELIDVVHLASARKTAKTFENVGLLSSDITGAAEILQQHILMGGSGPIPVPAAILPMIEDADLVVSASVLSQLPLVLLETARKGPGWKDPALVDFARGILEAHLTALDKAPGTVCLITEVERQYYQFDEIIEAEDPLFGLNVGEVDGEWHWEIAPPPEIDPRQGLRHRMASRITTSSHPPS
jgi:hypothetical protein